MNIEKYSILLYFISNKQRYYKWGDYIIHKQRKKETIGEETGVRNEEKKTT